MIFGEIILAFLMIFTFNFQDLKKEKYLGNYKVTTYYTPVKNQSRYYEGSYARDYEINCSGNCLITASGHKLKNQDSYKVLACPKSFKFGTIIKLHTRIGILNAVCQDVGGAIKGKKFDLWVGIGEVGIKNITTYNNTRAYLLI